MSSELVEPAGDVLEAAGIGDVVDDEGAQCAAVVSSGDCTVALLACCVPYLGFDELAVDEDCFGLEFDEIVQLELVQLEMVG